MVRRPRFGRYVAVDWSARAVPASGPDSIWIAVLDGAGSDDEATPVLHNPRTRHDAARLLTASIRHDVATLVGVDVGLGYPSGTAACFGLAGEGEPPWRAMWRHLRDAIADDARNVNNRFAVAAALNRASGEPAGPFWGCPATVAADGLGARKPPPGRLAEFRAAERALRAAGRSPMSMWQLTGAGSVGSQSLTAIPLLERWHEELGERLVVWPFACGLVEPAVGPGDVVVAEVWPTQFDPPYLAGVVRDAAQVDHVARRLATADRSGELAGWFAPAIADGVADAVVGEEGWVLGPVSG